MLAELKRIVLDVVGRYHAEVYLIGSFARGLRPSFEARPKAGGRLRMRQLIASKSASS